MAVRPGAPGALPQPPSGPWAARRKPAPASRVVLGVPAVVPSARIDSAVSMGSLAYPGPRPQPPSAFWRASSRPVAAVLPLPCSANATAERAR